MIRVTNQLLCSYSQTFLHSEAYEQVLTKSRKVIDELLMPLLHKARPILLYGVLMAILVFGLKWLQWKFLIVDNSLDIYVGLIAVFFTVLGVWVATQLGKSTIRTVVVEKEVYVQSNEDLGVNETELKKLNLSNREYEVLHLLTKGYSNAEIADRLCLSVSTVKTHVSNLFVKMDVKSRTQAIEKAKRLKLTA